MATSIPPQPQAQAERGGMTFLFVAPRYHTNQVWAVRALQGAGHRVRYLTLYVGATEDHTDVRPEVVRLSLLGRALVAAHARGRDWMISMQKFGVPSLRSVWWHMRRTNPDVVVVRDPTGPFALACVLAARALSKRVILYTQGGMVVGSRRKERIKSFLLWLSKGAWMTPVMKPGDATARPHRRMFYVPFVSPPVSRSAPTPDVEGKPVRLLAVGKFEERKNHLLLLEAMAPDLVAG